VLPAKAGTQVQASKVSAEDDGEEDESNAEPAETGSSHKFVWWTLGVMAVLAGTLALVFNTKN
jgi:hypothetical protein